MKVRGRYSGLAPEIFTSSFHWLYSALIIDVSAAVRRQRDPLAGNCLTVAAIGCLVVRTDKEFANPIQFARLIRKDEYPYQSDGVQNILCDVALRHVICHLR
jgi:hypothetical protein